MQMVRHHLNPLRGGGVLDPQLLRRVTATAFLHGAAFLVVLVALAVALAVARVGGRFAAAGAAAMQAACRKGGRMQEEGAPRMREEALHRMRGEASLRKQVGRAKCRC
mmetsp:Transcript_70249/g.114092  ORF Transcript_70249/g.114092 Transcript_70249/m.114092 type:complete len:108 (-) Transcript_70249:186-509(-)